MDTRRDADRIDGLRQHLRSLEAGTTSPRVTGAVAAREIREIKREIATLERLHGK